MNLTKLTGKVIVISAAMALSATLVWADIRPADEASTGQASVQASVQKENGIKNTVIAEPSDTQDTEIEYGPIEPIAISDGGDNNDELVSDREIAGNSGDAEEGSDACAEDVLFETSGDCADAYGTVDISYESDDSGCDSGDEPDGAESVEDVYITEDNDNSASEDSTIAEEAVCEESTSEESEWTYYGQVHVTHYCHCAICNGVAGNNTASGEWPTVNHTVATGYDIPFGTEIMINGQVYVVEDRGVGEGCVDIFVEDHQLALELGEYWADMYVRWQ